MLTIKMRGCDGTTFHEQANHLGSAIRSVKSAAIGFADSLCTAEWDKAFPLYWQVISTDRELIASGHVDETGCIL